MKIREKKPNTELQRMENCSQSVSVKKRRKAIWERWLEVFLYLYFSALGLLAFHYGRRVFVAEKFIIPTYSMYPTLIPGDRIMVNKLYHGGRIYKSFDFEDHAPLESFRMPGFRKIRPGDVVVFNEVHPFGDWSKMEFKINKVFCKRTIGVPGDSVWVTDGMNHNNHYKNMIGVEQLQKQLFDMPDSFFMDNNSMMAYPYRGGWTIKNWGPLYLPEKGFTIELDEWHCALYRKPIEYETGKCLEFSDGKATLDGEELRSYTFTESYYYVLGDNSPDSQDSRYWGFVPEEFMIGVATRIVYSRDRNTNVLRRERIWKKI